MRRPRQPQLSLFEQQRASGEGERSAPAQVVSLAAVRSREDARQNAELDSRIIARAAHLLRGEDDKSRA